MNNKLQSLDDSYDEVRINNLKKQIALSKTQLIDLVNDDDKFNEKLKHFNRQGYRCIEKQLFYEAIVYLNQAELTLEYAASCGKTIDRALILNILHNEACVYQRIWELQKSADYIEGIIYNITSFLEGDEKLALTEQILDDKSFETQKLAIFLHSKLNLVCYYLQFCAVNSQLKRHQNSLSAASKSLDILKEICEEEHQYESFIGAKYNMQLQKIMLLQLQNIKDFKDEGDHIDKNLERFMNKAKKSISMFQKKIKFPSTLLDYKQIQQLQDFSIGNVMQIYPLGAIQVVDKKWLKEEFTPLQKIYKALYISIAHFTMATQLRLIAANSYPSDLQARKASTEFKSSQLHHLISIITVALYVPYETLYFEHILNSHKNHYGIDLSIISESTLTEQLSKSLQQDDQIHLQISSLYRKKNKQQGKEENKNIKSIQKITGNNSPCLHEQLKKSKQKIKSSKVSHQNLSVKQKCKMIADSQRQTKESKAKSTAKSVGKKSKSKKKAQSRNKQSVTTLNSPISQRKIPSQTTLPLPTQNSKPPIPTSRSKSKNKKKSNVSKRNSEFNQKSKQKYTNARSQQQYGFIRKSNTHLIRKHQKKSLKSSQKHSQLKKSNVDSKGLNELKYIRQGRSPNALPKPIK